MKYFPLLNFTHYSLQKGFSKPEDLAKKCKANGYRACGIADYKSISGAVSFYKACVENKIKPIIGCAFDGFTLFAKNKAGWLDLVEAISLLDENLDIDNYLLSQIANRGNMICVSKDESKSPIKGQNFYFKSYAFDETYYVNKPDAILHRVLLCSAMKTTLPKINTAIKAGKSVENQVFFESNSFFVPDANESSEIVINDTGGINALEAIFAKCEEYNILNQPMLPKFPTPSGESEEEYLKELCRVGWRNLLSNTNKVASSIGKQTYVDRFNKEFEVIKKANLFGYFLIIQDIIKHVQSEGCLTGPGRGSSSGCLVSYLIGITQVDPIEFDLLFERFYNSGRATEGNISLPDIDIDVPTSKRDDIIAYLRKKYGNNNVSQMLTFGRLQGRSAIKEVLRVYAVCGFGEMNEITKYIPDEAAISDQLVEMDDDERSIIRWALINNANDLRDYCYIDDDGKLRGDYSEFFQQAIDIEGTFKTQGKHAAGVVISAEPLYKVCPMVNQKSGTEKIAGLEMSDLEALGHVKFDLLGLSLLDKIMKINELVG